MKKMVFGEDELVEWLLLFEAAMRKELKFRAMDNQELQEAMEKSEVLSRDPEAIRQYEQRYKEIADKLSVVKESERRQQLKYEEGLEKGMEKGKAEVALKLLQRGLGIEGIEEVTGLQ